jgi:hypothetical protein
MQSTRSRPKQEQEHHGHSAVKSHVAEGCHDLLKRGVLSQDTTYCREVECDALEWHEVVYIAH